MPCLFSPAREIERIQPISIVPLSGEKSTRFCALYVQNRVLFLFGCWDSGDVSVHLGVVWYFYKRRSILAEGGLFSCAEFAPAVVLPVQAIFFRKL